MPIFIVDIERVPEDEILEVLSSIDQLQAMVVDLAQQSASDPDAARQLRTTLHRLLDGQEDATLPIVMEGFMHHHLQIRAQYKQELERRHGR